MYAAQLAEQIRRSVPATQRNVFVTELVRNLRGMPPLGGGSASNGNKPVAKAKARANAKAGGRTSTPAAPSKRKKKRKPPPGDGRSLTAQKKAGRRVPVEDPDRGLRTKKRAPVEVTEYDSYSPGAKAAARRHVPERYTKRKIAR